MKRYLLIVLAFLTGCSGLEHRSDMLPRKKLAELSTNIEMEPVWSVKSSSNIDLRDSQTSIAEYKDNFVIADNTGMLSVIDKDGKVLWKKQTELPISAGPIVYKDYILLGTHDARLVAFSAVKGQNLWSANVTGEILAKPSVKNDAVYVHTLDGKISAHHLNTGNKMWQYSTNAPTLVLRKSSSPVIDKDRIMVGSASGSVLSLKSDNGTVDWEQEVNAIGGINDIQKMKDISADVIVEDGKIFAISYQGNLVALSAKTGYTLWTKNISSFIGMIKQDDSLYIADNQGYVWSVETNQGIVRWTQKDLQGRFLSKPKLFKGYVAVGDDSGVLHLLSKDDGSLISRIQVDKHGIESQPVVNGDKLVVFTKGGSLAAYKLK